MVTRNGRLFAGTNCICLFFFIGLIGAAGLIGCDSANDAHADTETSSETGVSMDAITGATPGVKSSVLTAAHPGAGKANCFGCHDDFHVHNYTIDACVTCHGVNQAPLRLAGHDDMGCKGCHTTAHPDLGDVAEDGCRSCHLPTNPGADACAYSETYDVVVIGGGGGGLAAAATLAKMGLKTLLVEQHYKVGGCMVTFDRGEYRFEASLHAYDGWGLSYLNALGVSDMIEPVSGDIMYRLVYPDFIFDVPADKDEYMAALKQAFPAEADNIEALFNGFARMGEGYEGLSLAEAVASHHITDDNLISILTVLAGFLAETPDTVAADDFVGMWGSYHQLGYFYFTGGSQSITDALEAKIIDAGGVIKRHTRATEITVADGRATGIKTADGGCYAASAVISNASAPATYLSLLGEEHLSGDFAQRVKNGVPAVSDMAIVFLGVDADFTEYFPGHSHEIFVGSGTAQSTAGAYEMQCLPESADFILSNYSVLDRTAAPGGMNAIVISAGFMGYDCENEWRFNDSYDSYADYKQTIARVLIARAEKILPGLSSHIRVMEVASPKTVEQYTLNPGGSWAGWAMDAKTGQTPTSGDTEPVDGLFTAGAWNEGAGQSVVLSSGIGAATAAAAYLAKQK